MTIVSYPEGVGTIKDGHALQEEARKAMEAHEFKWLPGYRPDTDNMYLAWFTLCQTESRYSNPLVTPGSKARDATIIGELSYSPRSPMLKCWNASVVIVSHFGSEAPIEASGHYSAAEAMEAFAGRFRRIVQRECGIGDPDTRRETSWKQEL